MQYAAVHYELALSIRRGIRRGGNLTWWEWADLSALTGVVGKITDARRVVVGELTRLVAEPEPVIVCQYNEIRYDLTLTVVQVTPEAGDRLTVVDFTAKRPTISGVQTLTVGRLADLLGLPGQASVGLAIESAPSPAPVVVERIIERTIIREVDRRPERHALGRSVARALPQSEARAIGQRAQPAIERGPASEPVDVEVIRTESREPAPYRWHAALDQPRRRGLPGGRKALDR